MEMLAARECLASAQKDARDAQSARDKTEAGLGRAHAIMAGICAEIGALDALERAETVAVADALQRGEDPPKAGPKKSAYSTRSDLEARSLNMRDVIAELENQFDDAEKALESAKVAENQARDGVLAAYVEGRLAEAQKLFAAVRQTLPLLNVAARFRLDVGGLRDFVFMPACKSFHEQSTSDPLVVTASAQLRAWKVELESDPMAEPSTEAGAALEAAEASAQAAREATERDEAEKYQAEMAARRKEQYRPQREANEKFEREHRSDPTLRNRFPLEGTYLPDPCAVTLRNNSHEGNSY